MYHLCRVKVLPVAFAVGPLLCHMSHTNTHTYASANALWMHVAWFLVCYLRVGHTHQHGL